MKSALDIIRLCEDDLEPRNKRYQAWKMLRVDKHTEPLRVEVWQREYLYDVGEFTDMPGYETKIRVTDTDGSQQEFEGVDAVRKSSEFVNKRLKAIKAGK